MRLIIFILAVLTMTACQPADISTEGKYVSEIIKNEVRFSDGTKIQLDNCADCKTIFLVRHAEKDTVPAKNPILTDQGYDRSYKLAQLLKSTRIDAIYSTIYNRTMHTVDSLATIKGLPTTVYQPKEIKSLSETIWSNKALKQIIISGHSNTTPGFASALMGQKMFDQGFDESDYDNFLIVNKTKSGENNLYKLRYAVK